MPRTRAESRGYGDGATSLAPARTGGSGARRRIQSRQRTRGRLLLWGNLGGHARTLRRPDRHGDLVAKVILAHQGTILAHPDCALWKDAYSPPNRCILPKPRDSAMQRGAFLFSRSRPAPGSSSTRFKHCVSASTEKTGACRRAARASVCLSEPRLSTADIVGSLRLE